MNIKSSNNYVYLFMGLFDTTDNISKIKFGDVFDKLPVVKHISEGAIYDGIFFISDTTPDICDMHETYNYRVNISHALRERLKTLPNLLINTTQNIPTQLIEHFSIPDYKTTVTDKFINFQNNINIIFRTIYDQHILRHNIYRESFPSPDKCGYIHFTFYKNHKWIHWFLPVKLKEGWG